MIRRARTILFWTHLVAGVSVGLVIVIMCVTGALLAIQPQVLDILERNVRRIAPAPGAQRLGAQTLLEAAIAAKPGAQPSSLALESDPSSSAVVAFGQDGNLFVDPYSGAVLGAGAVRARSLFRTLTDWHRYLGVAGANRPTARAITGASNAAFLLLAVSGLLLWLPRVRSGGRLLGATRLDFELGGKARDFNWHNVIGFYTAPILIVLTASGLVLSYPWANRLVYTIAGSPAPGTSAAGGVANTGTRSGPSERGRERVRPVGLPGNLDVLWARAEQAVPTWGTMTMRLGSQPAAPVTFSITDAQYWNAFARSTLTLDAATADALRWEPYAAGSRGQKLRGWIRFAHTGELGGAVTEMVAGLACASGAVLVWTGWALAIRRLARARRTSTVAAARAA